MKNRMFLVALVAMSISSFAAQDPKYVAYISQWRDVALQHEQEYHVPACITLAQGILESAAGTSELAVNANNHFGIKCTSDWMGDVYRYDDDRRGECFRVYRDAEESFRDHAKFLQRSRYERLFTLDIKDYAAWAQGLKDCGYATDPAYPQKLIRLIEEYGLNDLSATSNSSSVPSKDNVVVVSQQAPIATFAEEAEEEYVRPLTAKEEKDKFFAHHGRGTCNGVKYTVAREGDTYSSVAFSLNMSERKLREMNDALGRTLANGDRIYLAKKKSQAPKDKARVWVKPGEKVWDLIQREGITDASFRAMNGLPVDVRVFKTRQQVLLRKEKE